jgi:hypothetical protein
MGPTWLMLCKNQQRVQQKSASFAFLMTNRLNRDDHLPNLDVPPDHPIKRSLANDLIRTTWAISRKMAQRALLFQAARLNRAELLNLVDPNAELQDI